MTDEELLQVPHHRNIPADLVALLLQRIHDGRVKTGSTAQVFVNDAPTICDWCFDRIVGDAWMECDAWHLCRPCYRALTDSSDLREFRQRRPAKVHPTNCGPCVDCKLAIDMFAQNIANETDEEILRSIRHEGITTKMTMNIDIPWDFYPNEDKFGRTFAPDSLDTSAYRNTVDEAARPTELQRQVDLLKGNPVDAMVAFGLLDGAQPWTIEAMRKVCDIDVSSFATAAEQANVAFRALAFRAFHRGFGHIPSYTSIGFVPMSYAHRSRDRRRQIRRFARAEAMMSMPAREWYLRVSGRASKFRAVVPPEFRRGGDL